MIRRLAFLLALAGVGWYLFSRFAQPRMATAGNTDTTPSDEQGGGVVGRVSRVASGAASTALRAAQRPIEQARSLVGGGSEQDSEGEAPVTPRSETGATMPPGGDTDEQAPHSAPSATAAPAPSPPRTLATEKQSEPERTIKGNIRADGEKIYHMPQDPAYERTNAEEMFATVEEAEAAGFRRAGRPREQ